jgi:hypothetical protein
MARLRDRVQVIVEAGYRGAAVGGMTWDVSHWDTGATWSGLEPTWVELNGWTVESVRTQRGRQRANERHPAGTATVVLVYRTPRGAWSFRPTAPVALGQEMRVRARPRALVGGATLSTIPLFRGAIRQISDTWTPSSPDHPGLFRLTCSLSDRFADLGAVNLPEQSSALGLDDLTGARLARILGLAGVPTAYLRGRDGLALPAGAVHHQSSTFARNLLDEFQVAIESETGDAWVDREGYIAFRERLGTGSYARETTQQVAWSNDGTPGSIAPGRFGTGQHLNDVVNQVSRSRVGGTAYTAGGPSSDSALRYGLRTNQRFDLTCRNDPDVAYCADYWYDQLSDRTQRIDQLQARIDPNMADARLVDLLDVEIGDRHDITWTDYLATMTGTVHVQGVSHTIDADSWLLGVDLWAYAGEGLTAAPDRWGSSYWGTAIWGV